MSLVSIAIPAYNQPEHLRQAVESVLAQDYPEIEIIIGDDSTNDGVKKVVEQFLSKPQKFPIYYYKHDKSKDIHPGLDNSFFVIEKSHGEFVNLLHHDDIIMPNKISTMMKFFEKDYNKKIAFVTSNRLVVDDNGKTIGRFGINIDAESKKKAAVFTSEELVQMCFFTVENLIGEPSVVMFRKEDLFDSETGENKLSSYLGKFYPLHTDLPTWLELCRKKDSFVPFIMEPLTLYRRHSQQNTSDIMLFFGLIFEWTELLTQSFLHDTFIHDTSMLKDCYTQWLKYVKSFFENSGDELSAKSEQLSKQSSDLDILMQMIEAAEKQDTAKFLQLSLKKKTWED